MIEVEITNYESITHTKLQIEGFTTLVGRNYLGKSSVLRAINAALTNKEGTDFISWGKNFCEVHLKFPHIDILWHKEDGNNFYKIDGKEYTKIGRGNPPQEILNAGFRPISVGDLKINLNYAIQFFPLFLVNKRDSKSADVLTSVYGLDKIYTAIDLCHKDQRYNMDLLRVREKDLKIVEDGMEKFSSFPDIITKLPDIKKKKIELCKDENEIKIIRQWVSSVRSLAIRTKRLRAVVDVKIPESDMISENIIEYGRLYQYNSKLNRLSIFLKKVKPIHDLSMPIEIESTISNIFSEYQQLVKWQATYTNLSEEAKRLKKVRSIALPSPASINIEDLHKLQNLFERVNKLSTEVRGIKSTIDDVTKEMGEVSKEMDSFDLCPLCGAKRE